STFATKEHRRASYKKCKRGKNYTPVLIITVMKNDLINYLNINNMNEHNSPGIKPKKSVALSGVPAGNTSLCTVGKTGNDLHYRGYDILDLAENATFQEVAYLLIHETLPTRSELRDYQQQLIQKRTLPEVVRSMLQLIPKHAHPMDVLR